MKSFVAAALVAVSTLSLSAAAPVFAASMMSMPVMVGGAPMYSTKNIIENAVNSKDHTTLVAAVKAAGLVEALEGPGPFTVFAPTDAAFAKLPAGTVEELLKPENKEKLMAILTYHVVPGAVMAEKVTQLSEAKTVNGAMVKISAKNGKVMINDANVVTPNIETSNGVIHVIDRVILPPST